MQGARAERRPRTGSALRSSFRTVDTFDHQSFVSSVDNYCPRAHAGVRLSALLAGRSIGSGSSIAPAQPGQSSIARMEVQSVRAQCQYLNGTKVIAIKPSVRQDLCRSVPPAEIHRCSRETGTGTRRKPPGEDVRSVQFYCGAHVSAAMAPVPRS
jgi:hypothetical protein